MTSFHSGRRGQDGDGWWFLAELKPSSSARGPAGRGGPVACGQRITAPPSASRADWGSVSVCFDIHRHIHERKCLIFLAPVNVVNVVNVYPGSLSCARARARTCKGRKSIHDIHDIHERRLTDCYRVIFSR